MNTSKLRKKLEEAVDSLSEMTKKEFDGLPAGAKTDLSAVRILCEYFINEYKTKVKTDNG